MEPTECLGADMGPTDRRRVGGSQPNVEGSQPSIDGEVDELADEYLKFVAAHPTGSPSSWRGAALRGGALVRAGGDVTGAAEALWRARRRGGWDQLKGVQDPGLDGLIAEDLLQYLRWVETEGVPARSTEPRARREAKPHQSATNAKSQLYKQTWKDVHKGRVLITDKGAPTQHVHSSPFGAVDKLLPDRTLSSDKRIVHDQREVNQWIDPRCHPPAAQPRHRQIARLILYWQLRYPRIPVL